MGGGFKGEGRGLSEREGVYLRAREGLKRGLFECGQKGLLKESIFEWVRSYEDRERLT